MVSYLVYIYHGLLDDRYGTAYLFLQLAPPFSMLFLMTAAVSSALWAADMEKVRREQEVQAGDAPRYLDDPDATV